MKHQTNPQIALINSTLLEKIKENNPIVYQIIMEQQKTKWDIFTGRRFQTSDSTSTAEDISSINKILNTYPI